MYMRRSLTTKMRALSALVSLLGLFACASEPGEEELQDSSDIEAKAAGEVKFSLSIGDEMIVGGVRYQITGNQIPALMGVMQEEGDGKTVSLTVSLPGGRGYNLIIAAYRVQGEQACMLNTKFNVVAGTITAQSLNLQCDDLESDSFDAGVSSLGDGGVRDSAAAADAGRDTALVRTSDAQVARDGGAEIKGGASAAPSDAGAIALRDSAATDASSAVTSDAAAEDAEAGNDAAVEPSDAGGELVVDAAVNDAAAAVDAAAVDAGPSECEVCSARECARARNIERARDCYAASGNATAGPAQGVAKSILCAAAIDCAHRTSCAAESHQDCYCGANTEAAMCVLAGPVGACRVEFENAGQTTDPARLLASFGNVGTPLGVAARLLECEAQRCRAACFPDP